MTTQRRRGAEEEGSKENRISGEIIDAAIAVHRELGPGLLESVYEVALAHELSERGFLVKRQMPVPVAYKGTHFDEGFRIDLLVDDKVIIELKTVEALSAAHSKQLLTYLRLTGNKVG